MPKLSSFSIRDILDLPCLKNNSTFDSSSTTTSSMPTYMSSDIRSVATNSRDTFLGHQYSVLFDPRMCYWDWHLQGANAQGKIPLEMSFFLSCKSFP